MQFDAVHIASVAYDLPGEDGVRTSADIEAELAPLYARFALNPGRLELMSGIRERRHYPAGTRPSAIATRAGARALEAAADVGIARDALGQMVFGAVCRDFLEPATASVVHRALGLAPHTASFDLSNACLGFANGMVLAAQQIQAGQLGAALVVAGEDGGPLLRQTLADLAGPDVTRKDLKRAIASLTIGSGGAAMVLCHRDLLAAPERAPRLTAAVARAATEHNELCQGDHAGPGGLAMATDSEALLVAGVALAEETWGDLQAATGGAKFDRVVTHQVGSAHRRALLEGVGLPLERDFPTAPTLGNIGSVSLPLTFARAREAGFIQSGHRTALLGIGSGLNCLMMAVEA